MAPIGIGRMRSSGCKIRCESSSQPASSSVKSAAATPQRNGDYAVLRRNVDQQRVLVRQARTGLASSLDRLGEHHVRNKEYDDAMDAFTEALHEKRSVYSQLLSSSSSHCTGGNDSRRSSIGDSLSDCEVVTPEDQEINHQIIDDIVMTLRNMGNVHSLRGEQDEAMRYYSEVTSLRASRSSNRDTASISSRSKSSFSGMWGDEDTSTLMSEINEDVKALDDLFRSISFRNGDIGGEVRSMRSKPLSYSNDNIRKRRRTDGLRRDESDPFKRSSSLSSRDKSIFSLSNNELGEALDTYRSMLDSYKGQHLGEHDERLNSFALRADLMSMNSHRVVETKFSRLSAPETYRVEELQLALEVFQQLLAAQRETRDAPLQDSDAEPQLSCSIASTLIRMGSLCYKLNDVDEELKMYREAKFVYQKALGDSHPFVAGTRKNIGMVLAERGEYTESMKQFEKARAIYLAASNGDEMNRDLASAISCMGNVKNRMGELDDALAQYTEALRIYAAIQETELQSEGGLTTDAARDVTATLKMIGVVHAKKGDLGRAMEHFEAAMALLKSSMIDSTPTGQETSASILTRIAGIHFKKGEYENAMNHYQEAYDLTVGLRGTNHPDVAGILHYMGGIHHKYGDYSEAMTSYQEAVRIYHTTLGPANPAVAATLVCIGNIHYKKRNLDSAMMFYREALRLNRDAYGLHHPDVAPTLKSIGTILTKKGEYDEAYDVFRDMLSIKCTVHGTDHPEVANAYKSLGNVHYKRGELADAERQYRHALSIYRRTRGEGHPDTASARTSIEHIRYWMKERGQRDLERRTSKNTSGRGHGYDRSDERSC